MGKTWTQDELIRLQNNYNLRIENLVKLFPNRSQGSIYHKLGDLGLFKYGHQTKYSKNKTVMTCCKCGQTKPLNEFCKDKHHSSLEISRTCKTCKAKYDEDIKSTPSRIYTNIKNKCNTNKKHKLFISREEFIEWYDNEPKVCAYCGFPFDKLKLIDDVLNKRVSRFSVDRKDNNKGYKNGNLILACKRCNQIKSDFFTYEEMIELAKIYIRPRWEKKLKEMKI